MAEQWLKSFERMIRREAPTITMTGYGRSRQVEGYYGDVEVERHCYSDVYCYVETGLGSSEKPISDALHQVHSFQKDRERGPYTFNVRWFGSEQRFIKTEHFLAYPSHDMQAVARGLCKYSGLEPLGEPSFVPSLSSIESDDLILFFCHDRTTRMRTASRRKYRSLRLHIFWLLLGGAQPEIARGAEFEPELVEEESTTTSK